MQWSNLGLVYRDLKQGLWGIRTFEVAVALDLEYEPAYNEWANVLYDAVRFDDALVLYNKAPSLDNSRTVVHHNRRMCLKAMGDKISAIADFETALTIDPAILTLHGTETTIRHRQMRARVQCNVNGRIEAWPHGEESPANPSLRKSGIRSESEITAWAVFSCAWTVLASHSALSRARNSRLVS